MRERMVLPFSLELEECFLSFQNSLIHCHTNLAGRATPGSAFAPLLRNGSAAFRIPSVSQGVDMLMERTAGGTKAGDDFILCQNIMLYSICCKSGHSVGKKGIFI
ncbi:MAG: hypothetical protein HDR56_07240 [Treponema sp.]|nr:hypothetical protein [Treponema sp.]